MIVLEPFAGLANRMRAIDSAVALAARLNTPLLIDWKPDRNLNCRFTQLFREPVRFTVHEGGWRSINAERFFNIYFRARAIGYEKKLDLSRSVPEFASSDIDGLRKYRTIYIATCHRFFEPEEKLRDFIPIGPIQSRIDAVCRQFDSKTVGVHIRRSDNVKSILNSPTTEFVRIMTKEVEEHGCTQFFLATDSRDEEYALKRLFRGKIISREKEYSRNSMEGIQDALVDLVCLSRTQKIIGSYWSSFSETAAELSGIELVTART